MELKRIALASALIMAGSLPFAAHAESNVTTGGGSISASARVNFSIDIPRFIFLRVGTGTERGTNATVDTISFTPPLTALGDGTPVSATLASGDLGTGKVTVRILGNAGNVSLAAAAPANLVNADSDTIPWTQISTAVTGGATHPTINGGGTTFTATGKVVNVSGDWTYTYLNSVIPAGGTYTGTVTYTATTP